MKMHTVVQGETLSSICMSYGILKVDDVYNHSANQRLKKFRPDPNILFPGDIVYIPELEPITYTFSTDQIHTIQLDVPTRSIQLKFLDVEGKPLANCKYELVIDNQTLTGNTTGEGILEETIPLSAKTGSLQIWSDPEDDSVVREYEIALDHLDPAEEISGIQARLDNLGYSPGLTDDDFGPVTSQALHDFQVDNALEPTGIADTATIDKLKEVHGS